MHTFKIERYTPRAGEAPAKSARPIVYSVLRGDTFQPVRICEDCASRRICDGADAWGANIDAAVEDILNDFVGPVTITIELRQVEPGPLYLVLDPMQCKFLAASRTDAHGNHFYLRTFKAEFVPVWRSLEALGLITIGVPHRDSTLGDMIETTAHGQRFIQGYTEPKVVEEGLEDHD